MMKSALALGIALAAAAVTLPTVAAARFDPPSKLTAPFSPNATIYRPDCWIKEDPSILCDAGGGRFKD